MGDTDLRLFGTAGLLRCEGRAHVGYRSFILQFSWGFFQNLAGLLLRRLLLATGRGRAVGRYREARVTAWESPWGLSLGIFLFLPAAEAERAGLSGEGDRVGLSGEGDRVGLSGEGDRGEIPGDSLLLHEYGHTRQSQLLGPLYLPVIGLSSLAWARLPGLERMRRRRGRSYYSFWPERWADRLGGRSRKEDVRQN